MRFLIFGLFLMFVLWFASRLWIRLGKSKRFDKFHDDITGQSPDNVIHEAEESCEKVKRKRSKNAKQKEQLEKENEKLDNFLENKKEKKNEY